MKKYLVLESFFHDRQLFEKGSVVQFEEKVGNYFLLMERVTDNKEQIAAAEKAAKAAKAE